MISKILVLAGGISSEKSISLLSGKNTVKWLQQAGYRARAIDPATEDFTYLKQQIDETDFVIIRDEDGVQQQYLDSIGKPYMGAGPVASRLSYDKRMFKECMDANNILIPRGQIVSSIEEFQDIPWIRGGYVAKPIKGGSSIDTVICQSGKTNPLTIQSLIDKYGEFLIEEFVAGTEITVGILIGQTLPVVEIIPPAGQTFDFDNKYNGETTENCPPKYVSGSIQKQAQKLALKVHELTGCKDISRVDMIIDASNNLYVLEINTIPGMSPTSLYPKAVAEFGLTMPQALDRIIKQYT